MIKILLIEDSAADARLVQLDLKKTAAEEFGIAHVTRLEQAVEAASKQSFDIILSDVNLPDSKGINTFKRLNESFTELPIIMLTGFNDADMAMDIVKQGAEDYIVKGEVKGDYLVRAIRYAIERKGLRKTLQEQNRQFEEMLKTDPLTGLFSRRYILDCIDEEVARFYRYQTPLSVIHLDVDDFKIINDDYGHNSGDRALKDVADFIRKNIRETDKAARYGGDEFLILLPDSDMGAAEAVCEKLNSGKIRSKMTEEHELELSLSIGAASAEGEPSATQLIDTADVAMLTAKKKGKGRYFVAAGLVTEDVGDEGVDILRESRTTLRELICQLIGAGLDELEREQDISDSVTEIMQLVCDKVVTHFELDKGEQRTLYNVIRIISFQDLGIPTEMLEAGAELSSMQLQVLQDRFLYNISLLRKIRFLQDETKVLEHLHEHYDGTGFPGGMQGNEIPLLSRIVGILYEYAIIMRRTGGINVEHSSEVLDILRREKGKKLDPEITELVVNEISRINENFRDAFSGNVLIVEDDTINVKLLELYLSKAGYSVDAAFSIGEGREKLDESSYDIVFLDIMFPDGDGRELLAEIKKSDQSPITVITSSLFDEETIESIKSLGADVFIIKPVKLRLLLQLLASYHFHPERKEGLQIISGLTSITELR